MYYNCFINLKNMLKILRKSQKERPRGLASYSFGDTVLCYILDMVDSGDLESCPPFKLTQIASLLVKVHFFPSTPHEDNRKTASFSLCSISCSTHLCSLLLFLSDLHSYNKNTENESV